MKVLIIAVDALDWNVYNELQCMPYLDTLVSTGIYGKLISSPIPLTPFAFYEFYTGKSIIVTKEDNTITKLMKTYRLCGDKSVTIYDKMRELNLDVGVIEMPCLGKLRNFGKFTITGLSDEYEEYNHKERVIPKELLPYIEDYPIYGANKMSLKEISKAYKLEYDRLKYIYKILQDYPCDVISTYIRMIDMFCHAVSDSSIVDDTKAIEDLLRGIYSFTDDWLEVLITRIVKPDIILLFSDHGFDPRVNQGIGWEAHTHDGMYVLHGTENIGMKERRIYQLHSLLEEVLVME